MYIYNAPSRGLGVQHTAERLQPPAQALFNARHKLTFYNAVTRPCDEQGEGYAPSDARASAREKESARGRRLRANLARARACHRRPFHSHSSTPRSLMFLPLTPALSACHMFLIIYMCVYIHIRIYMYIVFRLQRIATAPNATS